ncbi:hypothetical protein AGMMS50289_10010 [Betaproteobacteria bacterium]|nr:hypothetical protein AGMMS50289_10010 [Betaproteobacteria bacterium]
MSSISGLHIARKPKRYEHWNKIIPAWVELHTRYAKFSGDAAYQYTERSNTGILASAAYQAGYVALEEYQATKINEYGEEWLGRCDLWVSDGKNFSEIIEAKQPECFVVIERAERVVEVANNFLQSALSDARNTLYGYVGKGSGIAFLPVYASAVPSETEIQSLVEAVRDSKAIEADVIAWCFPEETRGLVGKNDKIYSGLFVVIKAAE